MDRFMHCVFTLSPSNSQTTRIGSTTLRRYNEEINLYLIIYGTVIGVIILLFLNALCLKILLTDCRPTYQYRLICRINYYSSSRRPTYMSEVRTRDNKSLLKNRNGKFKISLR